MRLNLAETITQLLAEHGQGEISRQTHKPEYDSFIEAARRISTNDLEVDDNPLFSPAIGDDFTTSGCWISAWI